MNRWDNVTVRFAHIHEKQRIKDIWNYCFEDKEPFLSWYFEEKYRAENTLVFDLGEAGVVSNLQMLPYTLNFHGRAVDVFYIVGAATLPEARGMGLMKQLLREALAVMKERGCPISILLPFKYEFYKKYGWETCYCHKQYKIKIDSLKPIMKKYGVFRPVKEEDIGELDRIYKRYIADKNGSIIRSNKDWKCILQDHGFEGGMAYLLKGHDGNEGYILYSIGDKTFKIHELAYMNHDAYRGLWGFVYAHSAQAQEVLWNAPVDDFTQLLLSNPQQDVMIRPFVMARAVDVEKLLQWYGEMNSETESLSIEIHDSMAPWNNGMFQYKEHSVERYEGTVADVRCSVNVFTQLIMGFLSLRQAHALDLLFIKDFHALEKAEKFFKQKITYINDYY